LPDGNRYLFELLKKKIVQTMQQSYPGINPDISEWKGQEITDFQEELLQNVNAHISEKWFYNHLKKENHSLPRIDILNLLSKYAGYINWNDFVNKNKNSEITFSSPGVKANSYFILVPLIAIIVVAVFFGLYKIFSTQRFDFTFYDAVSKEAITTSRIEVKVLANNESPVSYFTDSSGVFSIKTSARILKLVISAPYYKPDTIIRTLRTFNRNEKISLQADDYALMIHFFSEQKTGDWLRRREQLSRIIDDGAMIGQVISDKSGRGMELYNKPEFIDKLTMPTGSLRNIEILETKLKNDKIMVLKFRINR
jgi:hypothetical protein